jgi:hypothetical protein
MYPHVTQFETRKAELWAALRLDADRRAAARRGEQTTPAPRRPSRLRSLAAALHR